MKKPELVIGIGPLGGTVYVGKVRKDKQGRLMWAAGRRTVNESSFIDAMMQWIDFDSKIGSTTAKNPTAIRVVNDGEHEYTFTCKKRKMRKKGRAA